MRWNTRIPTFFCMAIISILVLAFIPLTASPAFADGEPPPEPTPTAELPLLTDDPADTSATEVSPEEPDVEDGEAVESVESIVEAESVVTDETLPAPEGAVIIPDAVIVDAEAMPPSSESDPYFTIFGVTYRFSSAATYCVDNYPGNPNCSQNLTDPFQDAITDLSSRGTPDDGTVYVENGIYAENVVIDGASWTSTPTSLAVQSLNGSGSTTVQGLTIQNMLDFILQGFSISDGLTASNNTGTLSLTDIVASSVVGTGITVFNHDGDIELDSVQANSNSGRGARIDNTNGTGDVTITDSQFNDNNTTPAGGMQGGLVVNSNSTVTLENVEANGNLDGDGASVGADTIIVNGGSFSQNTSPLGNWGNGLVVQTFGGGIKVGGMTASNNEESGAVLYYSASAADPANLITVKNSSLKNNGLFGVWAQPESGIVELRCVCISGNALGDYMVPVGETVNRYPCPDTEDKVSGSKHKYVGILLSTEEPKIVNATNGVLVTFPPIQVINPDELAIGKVWPRKKFELPAEIPETDTYMAGVEVQMINAEFIEGLEDGDLKIEFFIPGYLVEREFSVLWWDLEADEWVEVPFEFIPHFRFPGGKIIARWPETGTFILVLHP